MMPWSSPRRMRSNVSACAAASRASISPTRRKVPWLVFTRVRPGDSGRASVRHRASDRIPVMLKGKTAIVTGGARGIGAGIARVMAARGARVAVFDLDGAEAEKTASALDTPGIAVSCDVAVEDDTIAAVRSASERLG